MQMYGGAYIQEGERIVLETVCLWCDEVELHCKSESTWTRSWQVADPCVYSAHFKELTQSKKLHLHYIPIKLPLDII